MLLGITFFPFLCLQTFMNCGALSTCLITEVKQQWATLVLGWVTASGHCSLYLMALQLALVDRNPFWPCLFL